MTRFLRQTRGPRPAERAFTIIEMAITITVIGILAATSYNAIENIRGRTSSRNGILEVVTALRRARAEAFTRGAPVVFFARTLASGALEYGVVADYNSNFDPANIDTSLNELGNGTDPTKPDRLVLRNTLSQGVFFRRTGASIFSQSLPAPFDTVPANNPCTFCTAANGPAVVSFRTDGTARLGTTPGAVPLGGSFALVAFDPRRTRPSSDEVAQQKQTIAVLSRAGTIQVYDR